MCPKRKLCSAIPKWVKPFNLTVLQLLESVGCTDETSGDLIKLKSSYTCLLSAGGFLLYPVESIEWLCILYHVSLIFSFSWITSLHVLLSCIHSELVNLWFWHRTQMRVKSTENEDNALSSKYWEFELMLILWSTSTAKLALTGRLKHFVANFGQKLFEHKEAIFACWNWFCSYQI